MVSTATESSLGYFREYRANHFLDRGFIDLKRGTGACDLPKKGGKTISNGLTFSPSSVGIVHRNTDHGVLVQLFSGSGVWRGFFTFW